MKINFFLIATILLMFFTQEIIAQQQRKLNLIKKKIDPNSPEGIYLKEMEEGDKTFDLKGGVR